MFEFLLIFVVTSVFGFMFGSKAYLKRVGAVLLQMKLPADQVDKVVYLVSNYNKIQRKARKETREAYKKTIVESQLEKMKKENTLNG